MKKFFKKFKTPLIILLIILALVGWFLYSLNKKASALPVVEPMSLEMGDLVNSVSVTGTVESETTKKIYTTLNLPIDINHVEVGDLVKEGDLLCELDTKTVEQTLAESRATAGASSAINNNSITLAEKNYQTALDDLSGDQNGTIASAELAVATAKQTLERAEITYEGAVDQIQAVRDQEGFYDNNGNRSAPVDAAVNNRDLAYASYETAKQGVIDAEQALERAKNAVQQQLDGYADAIKTQRIASGSVNSSWVAINNTAGKLDDAKITSPINGVVTGVYVTEGAPATGLLYVIEDVNDLKVSATLTEYDLSLVSQGDKVDIKSDVTGSDIFDGSVRTISPTTNKTATGDNTIGAVGHFDTTIKVTSRDSSLRVGSKARMEIVYEKKENVMSVPFEALSIDATGKSSVFTLVEEVAGIYKLTAIPVETGMETDYLVEIISAELKPGDRIVASATGLTAGAFVNLPPVTEVGIAPGIIGETGAPATIEENGASAVAVTVGRIGA